MATRELCHNEPGACFPMFTAGNMSTAGKLTRVASALRLQADASHGTCKNS
ncbi:MAG TPA: hypothetical protein VGH59_16950 [Casimicrobiaceae bacterium]